MPVILIFYGAEKLNIALFAFRLIPNYPNQPIN